MSLDNTIEILRKANERTAAIKVREISPNLPANQVIDENKKNISPTLIPNEASQLQTQDYARSQNPLNPGYA